MGGADKINGRGGADMIFGDSGNDQLLGGAGVDELNGGAGTKDRANFVPERNQGVEADLGGRHGSRTTAAGSPSRSHVVEQVEGAATRRTS